MIVLDTNVVSELLRPIPEPRVEAWLAAQNGAQIYLSAVSEAELRRGVGLLPAGRRRASLADAIEAILTRDFAGRVLPFDSVAAVAFARSPLRLAFMPRPWPPGMWPISRVAVSMRSILGIMNWIPDRHERA